jgi:hypothetical protein
LLSASLGCAPLVIYGYWQYCNIQRELALADGKRPLVRQKSNEDRALFSAAADCFRRSNSKYKLSNSA